MKATIKLQEITKLGKTLSSIDIANIELKLENESLNFKTCFNMESSGVSLRVTSEHSTKELIKLCEWLNTASIDDSNLRNNESELKLFAKEMINTNKKLKQTKKL